MDLDRAIKLLREHSEPVPKPARLPTAVEIVDVERELGFTFHDDYRRFQLEASDVVCGVLEPARLLPDTSPYLNLMKTAREAWSHGVSRDCLAFCHHNGNYYFIDQDGRIGFWDHDDQSQVISESKLADWIVEDWLEIDTA